MSTSTNQSSAVGSGGANVRVSIFDLFIEGHQPTDKLSRSFDLCVKLDLII